MIEDNNVEIDAIIEDDSINLKTDLDYRGERGPVGETPDITIGKVDTLSPEDNAYVEKEGTKENITLNFGIPKGETGDIGPVGPTGPSGVYIGSDEPQDPEVDVWIDPTVNPENYVKEKELDDKLNSMIESGELIGPQGPQGIPGKDGIDGKDGVGITTITSGQSSVEEDKTITPITVTKTDGSSQIFNVEAKNGADGKDGLNGKDGVNGQNGQDGTTPNIQIGTVETLEPNEQATVTRTGTDEEPVLNFGIPKGQPGADGQPGRDGADGKDATINGQNTVEITTDNNITLEQQENILKFGLDSQLTPKQDAEGTDNTFDDGLESPLYDLGGDGKSEQVVTTGKNLCDGVNQNYYLNIEVYFCGYAVGDSGLAINVSQYSQLTVSTQSIQERYRVGCVDSLPTGAGVNEVPVFNGVNKDGTNDSITVDTTDYNYLIINATNLSVIQVEEGSVATSYEPYTGGQPSPSPDYPQEINSIEGSVEFACRGKNLFNKDGTDFNGIVGVNNFNEKMILANSLVGNQGYNLQINNARCQIYCQIEIDKDYYLSFNDKFQITTIKSINEDNIITNTLPNNNLINSSEQVIAVTFAKKDSTDFTDNDVIELRDSLQIEKGTQATSAKYEPYIQPNEVTFNLNDEKLRSVGDVKDELVVDLDTGDYYKLKNIEHIERAISNMGPSEDFPGWDDVEKIKDHFPNANNDLKDLTSYSSNICLEGNFVIGIATINNATLWLYQGHFNMKRKDWQENYPNLIFKLDYVIPNTETIKLGTLSAEDLAKLKTFKGYNNVTINTNLGLMNIRFTYGLDIKKYVDNKIAELSAQLIRGE